MIEMQIDANDMGEIIADTPTYDLKAGRVTIRNGKFRTVIYCDRLGDAQVLAAALRAAAGGPREAIATDLIGQLKCSLGIESVKK